MGRAIFYRQCRLVKKLQVGTCHQTSWLPEPFAVVGKVLKLKSTEGKWEEGWVVEAVSQHRRSGDLLPDLHREIKAHRRATGDSMPKQTSKV